MCSHIFGALTFLLLFGFNQAQAEVTKQMPPIEARTLAGDNFRLDASKVKKPTLIAFWATWCASCRLEIPALKAFFKQHGKDIDLVSISLDQDLGNLQSFVKSAGIEYLTLVDAKGIIADAFGIEQTPALLIVDTKGIITKEATHVGEVESALLKLSSNDGKFTEKLVGTSGVIVEAKDRMITPAALKESKVKH